MTLNEHAGDLSCHTMDFTKWIENNRNPRSMTLTFSIMDRILIDHTGDLSCHTRCGLVVEKKQNFHFPHSIVDRILICRIRWDLILNGTSALWHFPTRSSRIGYWSITLETIFNTQGVDFFLIITTTELPGSWDNIPASPSILYSASAEKMVMQRFGEHIGNTK
jgi:hypothetical protein